MSVPAGPSLVELEVANAKQMAVLHARAFPVGQDWNERAIADLLELANSRAFGLQKGGDLIAFAIVQCAADQAEILTIATAPGHQRQGYAARLLADAELALRGLGAESWLLDVAADNQVARAFYENLGFVEDGRRPQYYKRLEAPRVDAILMSRRMGGQGAR